MKETIGIIGVGFVGSTVYKCFSKCKEIDIETYDINQKSTTHSIQELCKKSDTIWVCVPTPMYKDDGSCNVNIVIGVMKEINDSGYKGTVVIKSTIIVGTTEKIIKNFPNLNIVYNPEFLTEANTVYDFMHPHCIYLGGSKENCEKIKNLYDKLFNNFVPYYISEDTSLIEMVKYTANSFLAVKVGFFNEMYQICKGTGY